MTFAQPGDCVAVTGATGFVGQTLVRHLATAGYRVIGISERTAPPDCIIDFLSDYHCADLVHGWPEVGAIQGLVHLAGLAAVGPSFERPQEYLNTNSAMVTQFFEYAIAQNWRGRAIIVSSGAVYKSGSELIDGFSETHSLAATSPYVVSKLLVENQIEYYRQRGIDAMVARPFNHIGPGQGPGFIVPDLLEKVLEWNPGTGVVAGNLDSARDYTDVRDIAAAYRFLLELERPLYQVYNVCSGKSRSGWEVLDAVCAALGKPVPPIEMVGIRAVDPAVIVGNSQRLRNETGWRPAIDFRTSIKDYVSNAMQ